VSMPRLTIVLGVVLIAIGVGFYIGTGSQSVTALIPAFLGLPIGLWACRSASVESGRSRTSGANSPCTLPSSSPSSASAAP